MSQQPSLIDTGIASFASKKLACSLSCRISRRGLVLSLDGRLDGEASEAFYDLTLLILKQSRLYGGLIVELSRLKYVSSTGIGSLTNILSMAKREGIPFYLCGMTEQIKSIFDLLGFTSFFAFIEPGEIEA